jgi:hypothetical protein
MYTASERHCCLSSRATRPSPLLLQLEVLALVCASLTDVRTMCAALCTSSSARQAILAKCSGNLQLQIQPSSNPQTAAWVLLIQQTLWLSQYGRLVGQLQLAASDAMEDADAAAVQLAIRPSLQLRHLQICVERPAALLKQLQSNRLTSLEIIDSTSTCAAACMQLPAALQRLTGLRDLSITGQWYKARHALAPALGSASCLTRLRLQPQLPALTAQQLPAWSLQQLPRQLVQLQLSNPDCTPEDLIVHVNALQQLQSLTLLYNLEMLDSQRILAHSRVWASIGTLQQLDLDFYAAEDLDNSDSQLSQELAVAVSGATQLTRLYGWWFNTGRAHDADALQMLSKLRRLESLDLSLDDYAGGAESFESFGQLFSRELTRLKSLSLCLGSLQQLALAQLCFQATQLTQLVLCDAGISAEGFVMLTNTMSQLRQLALVARGIPVASFVPQLAPPFLPRLEQLAICDITMGGGAPVAAGLASFVSSVQQLRPSLKLCAVQSSSSCYQSSHSINAIDCVLCSTAQTYHLALSGPMFIHSNIVAAIT